MLTGGWLAGLGVLLAATLLLARPFGWFLALGVPYAGIGGLSLLWLRLHSPAGLHDALFLVAVIWATDIGAYLAGRLLGGRKLAPKISPGKTWTGAIGGLLLAAAAGVTLAGMNGLALPVAVLLSLFAQGGDLLESAIKRKCGVKDSGRTIPGHGGLFDRLDGFLTAAPLAAILALSVHGGLPVWR
jgi:phosphatidate cytidylyltransferase